MSTDLTAVNDHPVQVLLQAGDSFGHEVLVQHQTNKGVTFAALDDDTLNDLIGAWEAWADSENDNARLHALDAVMNGVRDLLGLGE